MTPAARWLAEVEDMVRAAMQPHGDYGPTCETCKALTKWDSVLPDESVLQMVACIKAAIAMREWAIPEVCGDACDAFDRALAALDASRAPEVAP